MKWVWDRNQNRVNNISTNGKPAIYILNLITIYILLKSNRQQILGTL